jgi:hypothetical protein
LLFCFFAFLHFCYSAYQYWPLFPKSNSFSHLTKCRRPLYTAHKKSGCIAQVQLLLITDLMTNSWWTFLKINNRVAYDVSFENIQKNYGDLHLVFPALSLESCIDLFMHPDFLCAVYSMQTGVISVKHAWKWRWKSVFDSGKRFLRRFLHNNI